jgi:hypothetical protein
MRIAALGSIAAPAKKTSISKSLETYTWHIMTSLQN